MSILAVPLPRRHRIRRGLGLLGDSFSGNCHTIAATAYATENYGYAGALAAKTGLFPDWRDNQGKVGDNSGQMLVRLPACLASTSADLWLLLSRTNDSTTAGMSLADTKANVMKAVNSFRNTPGKHLIVGTGTPRFGSRAITGAALQDAIDYKNWVLDYVSKFALVVNIWDGFTEDMTVEGLHPNLLGGDFIGGRLAPIVTANFEFPGIPLPTDAGDVYSAIRPFGCLNANPLMAGTGGSIAASVNAVAGSELADGYKALGANLTGVSTRWYKQPSAVGEAQCIDLAGTMPAAGGYVYLQQNANVVLDNLAAGDLLEMVSAPEITGTTRGILGWEAELIVTKPVSGTSTTIYYRAMDKYQEPFTLPPAWRGALETQRHVVDKSETIITSRMGLYLAQGISLDSTVRIAQYGVRKV